MDSSCIQKLLRFQQLEIEHAEDIELFFHRVMLHLFVCLPQDRPLTSQTIWASLQSRLPDRLWRESEKGIVNKRRLVRPRKIYRWMNSFLPTQKIHTKTLLFFTSLLENIFVGVLRDATNFAKSRQLHTLTLETLRDMFAHQKRDLFSQELLLLCITAKN